MEPNGQVVDVIVAGAGPSGTAAALSLAQIGYSVTIIAPAERPADRRTVALLAGSVTFLDALGVWPFVVEKAAPLRSLRIVDGTQRLIRAPEVLFHAAEIGHDAFGHNVANADLTAALARLCNQRGIPRLVASVDRVDMNADLVTAVLDTGETVSARLIVAADGRRSRVRRSSGISVREWTYKQSALVANLSHTQPHHDTSTEFHTEGGPFTLVPLTGNRSSLVWVSHPSETDRRKAEDPAALAREIERRSASLLGAITVDGPVQAFPLSGMATSRFAGQRVALVSEAAHVFPPIGAQGLNLGYRDVAALAGILAGAADPGQVDLLADYDRSRRVDAYTRTAAVDALNRSLLTGFLPVQALRGAGLFILDRVPTLRRAVMRQGIEPG
ncbi:MAG: UbiH/UbiF family hydroxylase [Hyphomicrobiales bacterium]|nr:UbiH/UbiF family hydroxylase [Hyphomicrobiales bacterium]